jgi:hypothetical protein
MIPPAPSAGYVIRHLSIVLLTCGHWFQPQTAPDPAVTFYCPRCNALLPYYAHQTPPARDEIDNTPMILTMWETR